MKLSVMIKSELNMIVSSTPRKKKTQRSNTWWTSSSSIKTTRICSGTLNYLETLLFTKVLIAMQRWPSLKLNSGARTLLRRPLKLNAKTNAVCAKVLGTTYLASLANYVKDQSTTTQKSCMIKRQVSDTNSIPYASNAKVLDSNFVYAKHAMDSKLKRWQVLKNWSLVLDRSKTGRSSLRGREVWTFLIFCMRILYSIIK